MNIENGSAIVYAHVYAACIADGSTSHHAAKMAKQAVLDYVEFCMSDHEPGDDEI